MREPGIAEDLRGSRKSHIISSWGERFSGRQCRKGESAALLRTQRGKARGKAGRGGNALGRVYIVDSSLGSVSPCL